MIDEEKSPPDKIIRLVEYLTALARINTKIVRTLDDYRKILWVHNIPPEQNSGDTILNSNSGDTILNSVSFV